MVLKNQQYVVHKELPDFERPIKNLLPLMNVHFNMEQCKVNIFYVCEDTFTLLLSLWERGLILYVPSRHVTSFAQPDRNITHKEHARWELSIQMLRRMLMSGSLEEHGKVTGAWTDVLFKSLSLLFSFF